MCGAGTIRGRVNFLQLKRALACGVNSRAGRNQGNTVTYADESFSLYGIIVATTIPIDHNNTHWNLYGLEEGP